MNNHPTSERTSNIRVELLWESQSFQALFEDYARTKDDIAAFVALILDHCAKV